MEALDLCCPELLRLRGALARPTPAAELGPVNGNSSFLKRLDCLTLSAFAWMSLLVIPRLSDSICKHWRFGKGCQVRNVTRPLPFTTLAALYYNQGQYEKAEPLYERALAIYQKTLGAEHPDSVLCLKNCASLRLQSSFPLSCILPER